MLVRVGPIRQPKELLGRRITKLLRKLNNVSHIMADPRSERTFIAKAQRGVPTSTRKPQNPPEVSLATLLVVLMEEPFRLARDWWIVGSNDRAPPASSHSLLSTRVPMLVRRSAE